jgi:hypothetical protein
VLGGAHGVSWGWLNDPVPVGNPATNLKELPRKGVGNRGFLYLVSCHYTTCHSKTPTQVSL